MKILTEFKEFAVRGNVVDLAVGIIIGGAFGRIVSSMVNDVLMPPLGALMGGVDFSNLVLQIKAAQAATPAVVLRYGLFINAIIDFTIVAFAIFLLIKAINRLKREEPAVQTVPTTKDCPECRMSVPLQARRCPHCTSAIQ